VPQRCCFQTPEVDRVSRRFGRGGIQSQLRIDQAFGVAGRGAVSNCFANAVRKAVVPRSAASNPLPPLRCGGSLPQLAQTVCLQKWSSSVLAISSPRQVPSKRLSPVVGAARYSCLPVRLLPSSLGIALPVRWVDIL
jgi:hypothetical protein